MKAEQNETVPGFIERHIGPDERELRDILKSLNVSSLDELTEQILPKETHKKESFHLPPPLSERELLEKATALEKKNQVFKSYIGQGYTPAVTPPVILRNVLENPVWYTSYTPYQPELAQGRLQALLNFQTLITDLTGMEIANSSLLDEGTAAGEAVSLAKSACEEKPQAHKFFVDRLVFPQTLEVLKTRAKHFKWEMHVGDFKDFSGGKEYFSALVQYPNSRGEIADRESFFQKMKKQNIKTIAVADLLSLCLIRPPGEKGADVVVGSSQRFGVPLFFGGPHAAFFATRKKYARLIPGRIVGVSKDRHGRPALRLALQTREQHIRRERATSNICTAQALLAVTAGFYAVYHGPEGLKKIALKIHHLTKRLHTLLSRFQESFKGEILTKYFFDTIQWKTDHADTIHRAFIKHKINLGRPEKNVLSWTLSETATEKDLLEIENILTGCLPGAAPSGKTALQNENTGTSPLKDAKNPSHEKNQNQILKGSKNFPTDDKGIPSSCIRTTPFLTHPVFNSFHSETKMLRYIHRLQEKELSLAHSMIPLGSCTMKLNGTAEMLPVTRTAWSDIHPFAPEDQTQGYLKLIEELEKQLCEITGFSAFSFQPNAGSQGEYAGLAVIKNYHEKKGEAHRNICLIPVSAHGTNPASAHIAGLKPVPVACTEKGMIDVEDLDKKLKLYGDSLSCMMITYPSTYGIFEPGIPEICQKVREKGGRMYLDGANMNALLGLCKPQSLGFDVCHLNLHKTFCIPHGGGGPGVGPVGVTEELREFLPGKDRNRVSSAPFGSAGILIVSWAYISLMGYEGLKKSAQTAMANANYIAEQLKSHYRILFAGEKGRVAHECILDFRKFKNRADISVDDVAKRLMDYSFHAPTMSWPVPGTLMVEPTESESKKELDRFCSAMKAVQKELTSALEGNAGKKLLFKNAPHTLRDLMEKDRAFPYEKQEAFYPLDWIWERKFWPPVSRVENAHGDIHLFCSCPPVET